MGARLTDSEEKDAPEAQSWRLRAMLALPACGAILVAHVFWGHEAFDLTARFCAGVIGCIAFISLLFLTKRTAPVLALALVNLYIAMARPVFIEPQLFAFGGPVKLQTASLTNAVVATLMFTLVASMVALSSTKFGVRASEFFAPPRGRPLAYGLAQSFAARVMAGVSMGLYAVVAAGNAGMFGSLSQPLCLVASPAVSIGLLFWDYHQTGTLTSRWLAYTAFVFLTALGLGTGMLGIALVPAMVAASLVWSAWGRLPWVAVALGVAFLLIFNAAKSEYRALTWYGRESATMIERAENWQIALSRTYGGTSAQAAETSLESTSARTAVLVYVAQIFDWVPSRTPHAGPQRWLQLPSLLIPRIFWSGKPTLTELYNNDYSMTFALQKRRSTRNTTINLPVVGDGYWRLGWAGVAIEGALLGLVLGLFLGLSKNGSREGLILGAALIANLRVDSHVIGMLPGIPQLLIVMWVILWLTRELPYLLAQSVGGLEIAHERKDST